MPALDTTRPFSSQPSYVFPDIVHLDARVQDLTEQRIKSEMLREVAEMLSEMSRNRCPFSRGDGRERFEG